MFVAPSLPPSFVMFPPLPFFCPVSSVLFCFSSLPSVILFPSLPFSCPVSLVFLPLSCFPSHPFCSPVFLPYLLLPCFPSFPICSLVSFFSSLLFSLYLCCPLCFSPSTLSSLPIMSVIFYLLPYLLLSSIYPYLPFYSPSRLSFSSLGFLFLKI